MSGYGVLVYHFVLNLCRDKFSSSLKHDTKPHGFTGLDLRDNKWINHFIAKLAWYQMKGLLEKKVCKRKQKGF